MANTPIEDWVVKVGFDTTEVEKGVPKITKIMSKLDKINSRTTSKQTTRLNKQNESLRKQNRLEAQRLSLRKKIGQAEAIGISDLKKERGALGGTNPEKIRARVLELDKRITIERKKQAALKAKEAQQKITKEMPKTKKDFTLSAEKQLKIEQSIDAVRRRAARGLDKNSEEFKRINRRAERLKNILGRVSSEKDLIRLNNQIRILRERTTSATAATRRFNSQMKAQKFAAKGVTDSMRNMARSFVSVFTAVEAGRAFFRTGKELESLRAVMLAASGTSEQAGKDFQFVKSQARLLGLDLKEATRGFAKLGIASKMAGFNTQETRDIFLSVAEAGRAFNLTAEKQKLTFLALEQIMSKGVVSMEELRRQLGEQIPGAFQIAAKSMNMTTAEFDKLVSSGKLASEDFIPKFTKELRKTVRESGSLEAAMKKVAAEQQRFTLTVQEATDAGFKEGKGGIASAFRDLTDTFRDLTPAFKVLGRVGGAVFKGLSFTLKLLTPVIDIFANSLDRVTTAFSNAIDLAKPSKELTGFEQLLRLVARAGMIVAGSLLVVSGAIEDVAKMLGVGEDAAEGIFPTIAALILSLIAFIPIVRGLKIAWKLLITPIKAVWRMLTGVGKTAAKTGSVLRTASTRISGMGASFLSALGPAKRFLGVLGLVATIVEGIKALTDIDFTTTVTKLGSPGLASVEAVRAIASRSSGKPNNNTTKVEDNRSLTLNPTIQTNNPEEIKSAMDQWSQDLFKTAIPTE